MKHCSLLRSARFSGAGILAIGLLAISVTAQDKTSGTVVVSGLPRLFAEARPTAGITNAETVNPDPTGVYRIGINDLLRIELNDVPGVPKKVRVQADGTINFPLAGENIIVSGKTAAEAAAMLAEKVKTVSRGGVRLKVAEYLSHTITILGLVDSAGEQQIQRDAVPFYVVKAMTNAAARADRVRITRANTERTEDFLLSSASLDNLLIYPGDSIEFADSRSEGN